MELKFDSRGGPYYNIKLSKLVIKFKKVGSLVPKEGERKEFVNKKLIIAKLQTVVKIKV